MLKARDISTIPAVIELLQGENVLKGFIAPGEFDILAENIPDVEVRDLVAFLYTQGWRSGERKNLEWSEVDLKNNMIRLPAEKSKSKKTAKPADHRRAFGNHRPAVSSPAPGLSLRVPSERQKDCLIPESLQSSGSSSESTGTVPHDMRRSAVHNFRRAGLSENEEMKLSGHETDSIYRRYDIISDDDLTESMNRVQEHMKKEAEIRKVVTAETRNGLTWPKKNIHISCTKGHFSRVRQT